jgi:aryl-alcohol dehydrogenase-like predicted oxidoreductase
VEYRTLGRTGVRVSALSLGALLFGPWGNTDEDECIRMIHEAIDAGINLVDTADMYAEGRSEEIVGRALSRRRDDVVLATKFYNPMGPGPNERGNSRLWIMRAVEASLRRLDTDHIDLYQAHRWDGVTDLEESLSTLTDLVRQGKVRYIGSSTFPAFLLAEAGHVSDRLGLERLASEQPPYSIFVRHNELDLFPACQRQGMGVLVWSPLAGGWLTGKYRRGEDPPPDSRAVSYPGPYMAPRFDLARGGNQRKLDLIEPLEQVAKAAGLSLTHLAMGFVLAHPAVTSAIIGPRRPEHLRDLLAGADVRLNADTLDAIDDLVAPGTVVNEPDRGWEPPWMAPEARRRRGRAP